MLSFCGSRAAILLLLLAAAPARGGLHLSVEAQNPLPAAWRGFLLDHRALRAAGGPQATNALPLRDLYTDLLLKLESAARGRPLTADELADLGAVHVRLGQPAKAVDVLRPAHRRHPDHFRIAANLGTAWQRAGDLEQAAVALEDAVRLAPPAARPFEQAHLRLVRQRLKEGKRAKDAATVDDLFGVRYVGPSGRPEAGARPPGLPANAAAVAQQLALWLPTDGRLLWQLAEIANATGDVRTAANLLDGCVAEFGMGSADLRGRRQLYRAAADDLASKDEHARHRGTLVFASARPLVRTFDPAKLPPVRADGVNPLPWAALQETTLGKGLKPTFLDHVERLDGKRVSLVGHVQPRGDDPDLGEFLLTEFPIGCWFCEAPDPTGLVNVELAPGGTAKAGRTPIRVEGVLRLNRMDPERFPVTVADAKVGAAD